MRTVFDKNHYIYIRMLGSVMWLSVVPRDCHGYYLRWHTVNTCSHDNNKTQPLKKKNNNNNDQVKTMNYVYIQFNTNPYIHTYIHIFVPLPRVGHLCFRSQSGEPGVMMTRHITRSLINLQEAVFVNVLVCRGGRGCSWLSQLTNPLTKNTVSFWFPCGWRNLNCVIRGLFAATLGWFTFFLVVVVDSGKVWRLASDRNIFFSFFSFFLSTRLTSLLSSHTVVMCVSFLWLHFSLLIPAGYLDLMFVCYTCF